MKRLTIIWLNYDQFIKMFKMINIESLTTMNAVVFIVYSQILCNEICCTIENATFTQRICSFMGFFKKTTLFFYISICLLSLNKVVVELTTQNSTHHYKKLFPKTKICFH